MPRGQKKRQLKANEKSTKYDDIQNELEIVEQSADNFSDQDEFLSKKRKLTKTINLFLQMPNEENPEIVKDF